MALLFSFQATQRFGLDWTRLGRADAGRMQAGEWWRAATALSLHADLPHVAGNILFGGVLGVVLAQSVGLGLAWWGFLLSGALGNLANAWIHGPEHVSLGASTAVFGALGLQVAYEWMRRADLDYRRWRRWVPVIMGFGLLAWLGAGGVHVEDPRSLEGLERVDIGAHALGFACGAGLGLLLGLVPRRSLRWPVARQAAVATGTVLALAAAWAAAIARS
jgi:membrane associated rhomboid family serine protease